MIFFNNIVKEVSRTGEKIDEGEVKELVSCIESARHIFVTGMGRSGLMIKAFANRLMHLGYSVSIVGEISSPHSKPGDLLLIGSGSGETASLINQAEISRKNDMKIALITANSESSLAKMADCIVKIPSNSKYDTSEALQPMGSGFEQVSLLLYDSIVLYLMEKKGETNESMKLRHADME